MQCLPPRASVECGPDNLGQECFAGSCGRFRFFGVVGYRLLARHILDLASGTFTAEKVKTGMFPWVIEADQMIASDSNYTLSNASFNTRIMTGFLHLSSLTVPLMTLTAPLPSLKESD